MIPPVLLLLFASPRPLSARSVRDFGRDPPLLGDVVRTDEWSVVVARNRHWSSKGGDECVLTIQNRRTGLWRDIDARDVREVRS